MRTLFALTLAALSLSATAAPKSAPVPLCEDIGVTMPDEVWSWVDGCDTDTDCEEAEALARRVYCATHPTAAYCACR